MKLINIQSLTKMRLASFLIVLAGLAMLFGASGINAQHPQRHKVGADLKKKITQVSPNHFVDVIIQPREAWSSDLNTDLTNRGATQRAAFRNFAFRAVKLKARDVDAIADRNDVAYVSLDREVKLLGHLSATTGADAVRSMVPGTTLDGRGMTIAVVDSGIDPNHLSTSGRIIASVDFTGENRTDDPYGHGTHVAGIAGGNEIISGGAYTGVTSKTNIVNVRVLNSQGRGNVSDLLQALDWILVNRSQHNIRVVNLSLGTAAIDSYLNDPLCLAARRLVNAGIVVVAAAGNEGKDSQGNKIYGQIHSPGNEPSVITVGATNTFGTDTRFDDVMATYSSRGPTRSYWTDANNVRHYDNLVKPDLVAPGNKIIAAQSANNYLVTNNPSLDANVSQSSEREMMYLSGTSMATPAVSGAALLMLQANPNLTPNMVKMILMYTAQTLHGYNHFEQGAGQLNIEGAVRLGRLVRQDLSSSTPLGDPLLTAPAPAPESIIGGETFVWSQGVVMDYSYATGVNLITKYQKVYGLGYLLSDGTIESNGVLMGDGALMSDGVLMGDNILTVNGVLMGDGSAFLSCGALMGDGTVLSDGALMGDGVLMGDIAAQASRALIYGDATAAMNVVVEP